MNSTAKVLDLPKTRFWNIDYRGWVWIILGWFVAISIHVLCFSRGHFIAQSQGKFLLLSPYGLVTASSTSLSDDLVPDLAEFSASSPLPATHNIWAQEYAKSIATLVFDQGPYGSCTANALAYAWLLFMNKNNTGRVPIQIPSRMFWYAEARIHMNSTNGHASAKLEDTGCYAANITWVPETKGSIAEILYPYTEGNLNAVPNLSTPPCNAAIDNVMSSDTINPFTYSNTASITARNMMAILASNKCIILGIHIYTSFMTSRTMETGLVPLPNTRTEKLLGGHCICLTGYNSINQLFSFKNTWGPLCGIQGTFFIPFAYICNIYLSGDAWIF